MVLTLDATWANAPIKDPTDPAYVEDLNPFYDAADLRRADTTLFAGTGVAALGVAGGIVRHSANSLAVTVDGADTLTVQAGPVVIPGDAASGTGCYRCANPAAYSEPLLARNATNPRIDLVVFRMLDVDVVGTHTKRRAQIEVIPGTPASSPGVPVKPSMAVELARVTVPPVGGGAVTVDSTFRTYATSVGGELLVTTEARLPAIAPTWQRARALDTGTEYTFNGATWDAEGAEVNAGETGWITVNTLSNGWSGSNQAVQYRRLNGVVYLRGRISGGTAGSTVFILPAGFRPDAGNSYMTTYAHLNGIGAVNVSTAGEVSAKFVSGGTAWLNLANISFPVA